MEGIRVAVDTFAQCVGASDQKSGSASRVENDAPVIVFIPPEC